MATIKNKDVVFLSNIEWDFQWQRHQIFASFFSQISRKVVFIESPAKRNPRIKDIPRIIERFLRFLKSRGQKVSLRKEDKHGKNLIVFSPLVLPSTFKVFRAINRKIFIPWLVESIKKQGITNPIVINYSPTQTSIDIINAIKSRFVIYDCVENFPEFPGVPKDAAEIENIIFKEADLVITDSKFLYEKAKNIRSDAIRILPGVDYRHFNQADTGLLSGAPKTLCYFGGVNERHINLVLLKELASYREFTIKIIGPIRSRIPNFPDNVIFYGALPYEKLPEHLKKCDCFILPYQISEFTKGVIPAKTFECFATGKPILGTPLPSFQEFEGLIYLGKTGPEWLKELQEMEHLENQRKYETRKTLAKENSWESRFEKLLINLENRLKIEKE
jgi:glycosyltransferase involved in cell wall biosynthesis